MECKLLNYSLPGFGFKLHEIEVLSTCRFFGEHEDSIQLLSDLSVNLESTLATFYKEILKILELKTEKERENTINYDENLQVLDEMEKLIDATEVKYHILLRLWLLTIEFMRILDAFGGEEEAEKISTMNNVFPFHSMSFMAIAFGAQFMDLKNFAELPCECTRQFYNYIADLNGQLFIDDLLIDSVALYCDDNIQIPENLTCSVVQDFLSGKPEVIGRMLLMIMCESGAESVVISSSTLPMEQRVQSFAKALTYMISSILTKQNSPSTYSRFQFVAWILKVFHKMLIRFQDQSFIGGFFGTFKLLFEETTKLLTDDVLQMAEISILPRSFLQYANYLEGNYEKFEENEEILKNAWGTLIKISLILFKNELVFSNAERITFTSFTPMVLTKKQRYNMVSLMFAFWLAHAKCTDYTFVLNFIEKLDQIAQFGDAERQNLYMNSLIHLFVIGEDEQRNKALLEKILKYITENIASKPAMRPMLMDLAVLAAENPEETFAEQIHKALSTSSKSLTPKDLSNLLTKLKESRKIPTFLIDEAKKKWIPSGELRREAIEFLVCQYQLESSVDKRIRLFEDLLTTSTNPLRLFPLNDIKLILTNLFQNYVESGVRESQPKPSMKAVIFITFIDDTVCLDNNLSELSQIVIDYLNAIWKKNGLDKITVLRDEFGKEDFMKSVCNTLKQNYSGKSIFVDKFIQDFLGQSPLSLIQQFSLKTKNSQTHINCLHNLSVILIELGQILVRPLVEKKGSLSSTTLYHLIQFGEKIIDQLKPNTHSSIDEVYANQLDEFINAFLSTRAIIQALPERITVSLISKYDLLQRSKERCADNINKRLTSTVLFTLKPRISSELFNLLEDGHTLTDSVFL